MLLSLCRIFVVIISCLINIESVKQLRLEFSSTEI